MQQTVWHYCGIRRSNYRSQFNDRMQIGEVLCTLQQTATLDSHLHSFHCRELGSLLFFHREFYLLLEILMMPSLHKFSCTGKKRTVNLRDEHVVNL